MSAKIKKNARKKVKEMANEQNLKPVTKRSKSEAREISRKGGIASGKSRARMKTFKEAILNTTSEDELEKMIKKIKENILKKGDIQSAIFLRDTVGQKPTDKTENVNTTLSYEEYIKKVEDKDEY